MFIFILFGGLKAQDDCLYFDGVDDYVNVNSIASVWAQHNQDFSLEFRTVFDLNDNPDNNIIFAVNTFDYHNRFFVRIAGSNAVTPGVIEVGIVTDDKSDVYLSGFSVLNSTDCHHIVFANENGQSYLYVNGVLEANDSAQFTVLSTDLISVGQDYDPPAKRTDFFKGKIDDFRLWSRALTSSEIFTSGAKYLTADEPDLLLSFNFDQGIDGGDNSLINTVDNIVSVNGHGVLSGFELKNDQSNFVQSNCWSDENPTSLIDVDTKAFSMRWDNKSGILFYSSEKENSHVKIFSISGTEVYSQNIVAGMNLLEIGFLKSGLYFINTGAGDNQTNQKFIKTN